MRSLHVLLDPWHRSVRYMADLIWQIFLYLLGLQGLGKIAAAGCRAEGLPPSSCTGAAPEGSYAKSLRYAHGSAF